MGGTRYALGSQDCLYVGKGSQQVEFRSVDVASPAKFYLLSAPAHKEYPTTRRTQAEAMPVEMGAPETANQRLGQQDGFPLTWGRQPRGAK